MRPSAVVKPCRLYLYMQTSFLKKRTLSIECLLCHDEQTGCSKSTKSPTGHKRPWLLAGKLRLSHSHLVALGLRYSASSSSF